jgi:hypothetical protein
MVSFCLGEYPPGSHVFKELLMKTITLRIYGYESAPVELEITPE